MTVPTDAFPRVMIEAKTMRSLRWSLGMTRWLVYLTVIVGVTADVRFALLPPRPRVLVRVASTDDQSGGEWFADRFVRAYLTWGPDVAIRERALAPFLGPTDDPDLGTRPVSGTEQIVDWTQIASRGGMSGQNVDYTVAAQTSLDGLVYVDVDLTRVSANNYVLARFPSIVAGPSITRAGALDGAGLPMVTSAALQTVLSRALENYLAGSVQDLDADLTNGAVVTPPSLSLALEQVLRLAVEPSGEILATVVAQDHNGTSYTLTYRIVALLRGGRWEVSAIGPTVA